MFHKKLKALNYPEADKFDSTDQRQRRTLVLWLEEQRIRHYAADQRDDLRQVDSDQWSEAYRRYLDDLAAPVDADEADGLLGWLMGRAIRLVYGDNLKKYQQVVSNGTPQLASGANIHSQNPLDNLDFNSNEFVTGVERLAALLDIPCHPDHLITLEAISSLVCQRLNKRALAEPAHVVATGTAFPLESADLGFDTGDPVLNSAAKVLRLLYIRDLRRLQTDVNESLVAVQSLIADPRTDTRLGKVGR